MRDGAHCPRSRPCPSSVPSKNCAGAHTHPFVAPGLRVEFHRLQPGSFFLLHPVKEEGRENLSPAALGQLLPSAISGPGTAETPHNPAQGQAARPKDDQERAGQRRDPPAPPGRRAARAAVSHSTQPMEQATAQKLPPLHPHPGSSWEGIMPLLTPPAGTPSAQCCPALLQP